MEFSCNKHFLGVLISEAATISWHKVSDCLLADFLSMIFDKDINFFAFFFTSNRDWFASPEKKTGIFKVLFLATMTHRRRTNWSEADLDIQWGSEYRTFEYQTFGNIGAVSQVFRWHLASKHFSANEFGIQIPTVQHSVN